MKLYAMNNTATVPAGSLLTVTVSEEGEIAVYPGEPFGPEHLPTLVEVTSAVSGALT